MTLVIPAVPQDRLSRTGLIVRGDYSFAVDGGAIGDINLTAGLPIPAGSTILGAVIEVVTVPTSGGAATIALRIEGGADVQAAAAISGAPWSTVGVRLATLTRASAPLRTTAARAITATIGTAALTAGVFRVLVELLPPLE